MTDEEPRKVPDRRAAIAAATLVAASAFLAQPKDANADLSFSELKKALQPVVDKLAEIYGIELEFFDFIREFYATIYRLIKFPSPERFVRLINDILEELGAGSPTYIGGEPDGPLETSYPPAGVLTAETQQEATIVRAVDTRARVTQSLRINGQVAQAQGELAMADMAIVARADAAGEQAVTPILQGIMHLIQNLNLRVGQQSEQIAALSQLVGDLVMLPISDREQGKQIGEAFIDGAGVDLSEPVDRGAE